MNEKNQIKKEEISFEEYLRWLLYHDINKKVAENRQRKQLQQLEKQENATL